MQKRRTDVLTKIRKDMEKSFSEAASLLVNTGLFSPVYGGEFEIPENLSARELLFELRSLDTDIVFYGSESGDFPLKSGFGNLIEQNGHHITDNYDYVENILREKKCVLIGSEISDIDFFLPRVFSIATCSAPLDLKMISSYVSNFDGESVFVEIGNLIVNSKKEM